MSVSGHSNIYFDISKKKRGSLAWCLLLTNCCIGIIRLLLIVDNPASLKVIKTLTAFLTTHDCGLFTRGLPFSIRWNACSVGVYRKHDGIIVIRRQHSSFIESSVYVW